MNIIIISLIANSFHLINILFRTFNLGNEKLFSRQELHPEARIWIITGRSKEWNANSSTPLQILSGCIIISKVPHYLWMISEAFNEICIHNIHSALAMRVVRGREVGEDNLRLQCNKPLPLSMHLLYIRITNSSLVGGTSILGRVKIHNRLHWVDFIQFISKNAHRFFSWS